jgi:hypothetical protein
MSKLKEFLNRPILDPAGAGILIEMAQDTLQPYQQTPVVDLTPVEIVEPTVKVGLIPEVKIEVDIPINKADIERFYEELKEGQIGPEEPAPGATKVDTATETETETETDLTWSNVSRQKAQRQTTPIQPTNGQPTAADQGRIAPTASRDKKVPWWLIGLAVSLLGE